MTAPIQVGPLEDLEDYLADIGDRIRAERRARGWSHAELGRRAGIGVNTAKRLEDGTGSLRVLVLVCAALDIPLWRLLSDDWRIPVRGLSLSPRQVDVLREAASGDSLAVVGDRLGLERPAVSSHLSRIYERLGVSGYPAEERRAAAVRVATKHGLITPQKRTS